MLVVTIRPGRPLMAAGGTWGLSDQPVSRSQQGPQILLRVRPVRARSSARASASNALHGPLGAMNGRVHEPGFAAKRRMAIGFPREKQEKTLIKAAFLGYIRLW